MFPELLAGLCEGQRAGHEEVKTLAGNIIAAQQREIDIMEAYFKGAHG
jgi:uncharacterized protein (DUF305 family)